MAIVVAYDIYLEVAEGDLCSTLRYDTSVNFWVFRGRLSQQQLKYKSTLYIYPGDENKCVSIPQNNIHRKQRKPIKDDNKNRMTLEKNRGHNTLSIDYDDYSWTSVPSGNMLTPRRMLRTQSYVNCVDYLATLSVDYVANLYTTSH
eukprot:10653330-Ditylum_brightwellii.AAC.1